MEEAFSCLVGGGRGPLKYPGQLSMRTRRHILLRLPHSVNNFFCLVCKAPDTQKNPVSRVGWGETLKFMGAVVAGRKDCKKEPAILDRKAGTERFPSVSFPSPFHFCISVYLCSRPLAGRETEEASSLPSNSDAHRLIIRNWLPRTRRLLGEWASSICQCRYDTGSPQEKPS